MADTAMIPAERHDIALAGNVADFDDALLRFLATRRNDRTRRTYERALALYRDHCNQHGLDPLRLDAVITYSTAQNAQRGPLSAGTIRLRLKVVQSFLTWCYAFGLTSVRPELVASSMTVPPARKLSPRDILTADEVGRLLAAAQPGRERLLLRVMLGAGLRVSEALALTAGDVYAANDRYYVAVAAGKGDKARDVEIPRDLFKALRRHTAGMADGAKVFGKLDRVAAWRIVQRVAARAKLEKSISPHSLRHTHAHHLRLAGMKLEVLSERLGHASMETTRIYTHPAEMAQAATLPKLPWDVSQRV